VYDTILKIKESSFHSFFSLLNDKSFLLKAFLFYHH
jgi:hypothetical protein